MSYREANGYSNGYRSQSNRYDDDSYGRDREPPSSSTSGRRNRRAGGYGGFNEYEGTPEPERTPMRDTPPRERERDRDRPRERERDRDRYRDRDRDRERDREPTPEPPREPPREPSPPPSRDPEPESRSNFSSRLDRLERDREERRRKRDAERQARQQAQGGSSQPEPVQDRDARTNGDSSHRSQRSNRYGTSTPDPEPEVEPEPPLRSREREVPSYRNRDRNRDRDRTTDKDRDRERDGPSLRNRDRLRIGGNEPRKFYGDGPAGTALEEVMDHIQDRWEVTTKADCVPVQVSLQLLDTSSLGRGRDYEDFRSTGRALHKGLKSIVNEHHQGFNSSLGTFHKIQSGIQASQERVQTLKASLITARANLTVTRAGLKGLATQSQNYEDMLQVLTQIEKLQTVPEQLDARISEKHFLGAVDTLQDGLRLIRNSNLENIGALADLRIYMNNQETSLTDILLEELHDHLYLKSPYTQNRWRPHAQITADGAASMRSPEKVGTGIRPLYRFLTTLNTSQQLAHDSSRNPEEDSFEYIHMLIEALNKMGRLELAVERIEQRLPVELFAVVEKTNQEVDNRHPRHLRTAPSNGWTRTQIQVTKSESHEAVLTDFLYTLYSKFEAIAEGHRAVHEVLHGIIERERIRKADGLLKGFKELWKLLQSEIRSLLHDYLTTDGSISSGRDPAGPGSIFKKTPRDKTKKVFKMGDMDKKQLNTEQEELDKILQASVPGLTSNSTKRKTNTTGSQQTTYEGRSTASHKLLVEANVFNISMLLPPSLVFLQRLKDTVPPDTDIAVSTLTSFLDDFLVNVFNPQLDDTASELCTQAFMQPDAFQEDPQWPEYSKIPIFKGTIAFYLLIKDFCKMLDDIPQDQMFTALLLNQLKTYHLRCTEWCHTLLSRVQNEGVAQLKPAPATVKEGGEMVECMKAIWQGEEQDREQQRSKLIDLLVAYTNQNPLSQFDNVSDQRAANALCLLYSSLQWLSSQLQGLRYIVKKEDAADSKQKKTAHRWTMLSVAAMRDGDHAVVLPLTDDSASSFDEVLASYRGLAITTLYTLHLDVRFRILQTAATILDAPYLLEQPVHEADRSVLQLNNDLVPYDEAISSHLPSDERVFLTTGLGSLLDTYVVTNALSHIKSMNRNGCERMQLNLLVLQQNLKSVERDVRLVRSSQFFDYFAKGPKAIVETAKETGGEGMGFGLDEMKGLVELCYSEALHSDSREAQSQGRRNMGEDTLQLTEYMWSV